MSVGMSFLRVLMVLLSFTLEVKVQAASTKVAKAKGLPETQSVLEEPENCLMQTGACAIFNNAHAKYLLHLGPNKIWLAPQTLLVRQDLHHVRLLQGELWLKVQDEDMRVETEFGLITSDRGEYWVSRDQSRVWVRSTGSNAVILPRGAATSVVVLKGFENWLEGVGPQAVAKTGIPQPIDHATHLVRWAKLFEGTKAEFETQALEFKKSWQAAIELASQLHQKVILNKIAEQQALRQKRLIAQEQVQVENQKLRALFRKKNYLGSESRAEQDSEID